MFAMLSTGRRRQTPAILVAISLLLFADSAQAQPAHPVTKVEGASAAIVEADTMIASGRASITLVNSGTIAVDVTVEGVFRHDSTDETVVASWTRYPRAELPAGNTYTLEGGETATFEVTGHFDLSGVYETSLGVGGIDSAGAQRFIIRMARTIAPLPDDFLREPVPVRIDLGALASLTGGLIASPALQARVIGSNTLHEPLDIAASLAGPLIRTEGDASTQSTANGLVEIRQAGCGGTIAAGASCALDLTLPKLVPGSYAVDLMVTGAGGGQSLRTVKVEIRASAWLAGLLIAAGVVLGAMVAGWRETSRQISSRRIEAALLRERATELGNSSQQPPVARRAREMVRRLRMVDSEVIDGADASATVAELTLRLEQLRRAEHLLAGAAAPAGEAAGMFRGLSGRLVAALESVDWPGETVDAAAKYLADELAAFPQLVDAAEEHDAIAAKLAGAMACCGPDDPVLQDWTAARSLRQKAFERLSVDSQEGKVVARASELDVANGKLAGMTGAIADAVLSQTSRLIAERFAASPVPTEKTKALLDALSMESTTLAGQQIDGGDKLAQALKLAEQLNAVLPTEEAMEGLPRTESVITAILPDYSGWKFELLPDLFAPPPAASAQELRWSARNWNLITNGIALVVTAALGVLVIWVPNPVWGSLPDVLLALLSGAGTRLALNSVVPSAQ